MKQIALLAALMLASCAQEAAKEQAVEPFRVLTEFTMRIDPAGGTIEIETDRTARGLAPITVDQDGTPGSGSRDTVELVTNWTANDLDGRGACGYAAAFCGEVAIRSFYTLTLDNVFSEVTSITPVTGHEGKNSDPAQMGLSDQFGLWGYGVLQSGSSDQRLWVFGDTGVPYVVRGRVMADTLELGVWDRTSWDQAIWQ